MKSRIFKMSSLWTLFFVILFLSSCRDEWETEYNGELKKGRTESQGNVSNTVTAHPGRALASNCFQCHGTNGYASELKIAGESSSEIIGELNEMKYKNPGANIMNVHAQAYTSDEIKLIADYFSKQ